MSSSPPPPPPPPFAPPPWNAGTAQWSRHAARDQRRAAALAAKQQKALLRAQMDAVRRRSLLGPLLLISLGILFLLVQLGRVQWNSALLWLGTWWPAVLVLAGIVLLTEWAYDTANAGNSGARTPRRSVGAGAVILLVALACVGASAAGLYNRSDWIERNWNPDLVSPWGLGQIFAQKSETQHDLAAPLAAGSLLTIRNYKGNITITGDSQDGQVHVSAHQRIWAWKNSELRSRQERDLPTLEREGSNLLLVANGEGADESDLTVEVPHEAALQVDPEHGDISVSELRGPVAIASHTGNIALTAVTGHISLSPNDDNATVSGHSLSGDITLDGRSGDLTFSDVTGPLTFHGDFFGTTHLERIAGPVHFQSSFTNFACASVSGELNVEGRSDLEGRGLDGPVVLTTSDRNLSLSGIKGSATIKNEKGSVTLSLVTPVAPVDVSTTDGSITVRTPEKGGFNLDAETSDGQINSNLGLTARKTEDKTNLSGKILSGGPNIRLRTTDGDISIHRGAAEANSGDGSQSTDNQADASD